MSRIHLTLVAFSLLTLSVPARAGFLSGSKLADQCKDQTNPAYLACMGYVIGVTDPFDSVLFCTPQNAQVGQLTKVVRKYLDEHPERLHENASVLTVDALKAAFPCKR